MSTILLNLQLSLQSDLLANWLTNADICKLDSAFCSKEMRPQYLDIMESEVMSLHSPEFIDLEKISSWMEWVLKKKVRINTCHISSAIPPALYKRFFKAVGERLKELTIFCNHKNYTKREYDRIITTAACFCTSLSKIQLQHCESSDCMENLLLTCQESLTVFHLLWCDVSKLKLRELHLLSLKRLVLEDCNGISEATMVGFLGAAPNLEILNCEYFPVFSSKLKISKNLRVLMLKSPPLTDAMFCSLVHSCPLLEVVQLSKCSLLTDVSIIELVQHATHLITLYMGINSNFTDASLEAIAVHCGERLHHLCLYDCSGITDAGLNLLGEACHQLEGFHTELMQQLSPAAIKAVLHVNPLLWEVSLGKYCHREGQGQYDALLTVLSTCCPLLVYCNLFNCHGYTEAGVFAVVESCSQLRTIVVHPDCTVISPLCRLLWRKFNPNIEIEVTNIMSSAWSQYYCDYEVGTDALNEEDA